MQLDREHFSPLILAALDDAARLVHITQAMWELSAEFKNLLDGDPQQVNDAGNYIIRACRAAVRDLMEAATKRPKPEALLNVRRKHLTALRDAVEQARALATTERNLTGEQGNVMGKHVHHALYELVESWTVQKDEAQ